MSEVGLRYVGSLRYGDIVKVRAWVEDNKNRRIRFAYEVCKEGDESILVTGFTQHSWTDHNGRVTRAPQQWVDMMANE